MIEVLIVDDHPVVLAGLTALIGSDADLNVVASARSAEEVRSLPDAATVDLAIVDLQLPGSDGITVGAQVKQRWPGARVVILTMHAEDATVVRSLGAGLDGYLLKDADPEDLLAAIHAAARGALVVGRGVAPAVIAAAAATPTPDVLHALDARDLEILELLTQGLPTSQIANRLYLAPKTIRNRISEMLTKLGVATRDDAVALARTAGIRPRR